MKKVLLFVFLFVILLAPSLVFADILGGPLVPECQGPICQFCDLVKLVDNILNFAIAFTVIVATIMFVYAGTLYVTAAASPKNIQKAHTVFGHVFVGFILVLAAWLIINIILSVLTGKGIELWTSEISCNAQPTATAPTTTTPPVTPVPSSSPRGMAGPSGFAFGCGATNDLNAQTLANEGIRGSSSGACCNKTISTCTSLDGMQAATLQQVIHVKQKCGAVTVTGGTETGHAEARSNAVDSSLTHGSGAKIDIAKSTAIDACIIANTRVVTTRSDGASQFKDTCGNTYARESDHWDITVIRACRL